MFRGDSTKGDPISLLPAVPSRGQRRGHSLQWPSRYFFLGNNASIGEKPRRITTIELYRFEVDIVGERIRVSAFCLCILLIHLQAYE